MSRLVVIVLMLVCSSVQADAPVSVGFVALDRSERILFPSNAVGDTFRVDVVLPIGYEDSDNTFPVVFVTDSNYLLSPSVEPIC